MVAIIGAGPVGNHLASQLSKKGFSVDVYEEHKVIGKPVQCTGITTFFLNQLMQPKDEFVVNRITRTKVFGPDKSSVEIKLPKNYIVDRTKFDAYLADVAQSNGAKYHSNHKFLRSERKNNRHLLRFANNKTATTDHLVGADGPLSTVAKSNGMFDQRKFIIGHQARIRAPCESDLVEFFIDEGYFGWLVPESTKISRLGICSLDKANFYFDKLHKLRPGKILDWQSGIIPLYNPKVITEKDHVYLVGDAATQVKASTLGGIIPGMIAAEELTKALAEGKSYERLWRKKIGFELWTHLQIHKIMLQKFKERDYNALLKLVRQPRITKLISTHDREFPSLLLAKMALLEPRFLQFLRFLW
ncbi:MAG TPA: NAD(P)/FAD-dependent oxidoreductase [Candidatus Nanoarchaeia archaeon]|nr:NAD(P)/FAD-dependent oxidoreductase [Candidatus Nanoarchaeia archaeon]